MGPFRRAGALAAGLLLFVSGAQARGLPSRAGMALLRAAAEKQMPMMKSSTPELVFLAVGDWGGQPVAPYTTSIQLEVAEEMAEVAMSEAASFVVALGDNFYETGIPKGDLDSPAVRARFRHTFEEVYSQDSLTQIPWHVLAGNHDHYGNVSAQIAYTKKSRRWSFPDYYYTFTKPIQGTDATVQFVMIDTVLWAGLRAEEAHLKFPSMDLSAGPREAQMAWVKKTLSESKATWVIVCGHYPVWSVAEHGPTAALVEQLKPMLEAHGAALYLDGHDHQLQHLAPKGSPVDYVVIGSGAKLDGSTRHKRKVPKGSLKMLYNDAGGFAVVKVGAKALTVDFVDEDGEVVYTFAKGNPRAKKARMGAFAAAAGAMRGMRAMWGRMVAAA